MTVLKTFCCLGSLKTGTILTAVFGALIALIGIILMFTLDLEFKTIILDDLLSETIVKIILVINFAMTIVISILLLIGAVKRNMYFMLPWVILGIMLPIGLLISVIVTAVSEFNKENTVGGIIWLVAGLLAIVIYIYFWLVVFSYFQIIRKEHEERSKYEKAPFRRHY